MVRKTEEERIQELEEKIAQMQEKKKLAEARLKEKERKARTRRLIQTGAIFEKYFDIEDEKHAEKIAYGLKDYVKKNKDNLLKIDVEKSIENEKSGKEYPVLEEQIITPTGEHQKYEVDKKEE